MDEFLGVTFLVFGGLVSLLPVIGIVVLLIMLLKKNNNADEKSAKTKQKAVFTFKNLIKGYLYFIISLTIFISLVGFTFVGKAAFGAIDKNFSYQYTNAVKNYGDDEIKPSTPYDPYLYEYEYNRDLQMAPENGEVKSYYCYDEEFELVNIDGEYYCFNSQEGKLDLINGATIIVSTAIIFVMHLILLIKIENKEPSLNLRKYFIFGNLMLYSLLGLITLPIAIYQLFNYLIILAKPVTYNEVPGGLLAFVIFTLLAWGAWLIAMLKNRNLVV